MLDDDREKEMAYLCTNYYSKYYLVQGNIYQHVTISNMQGTVIVIIVEQESQRNLIVICTHVAAFWTGLSLENAPYNIKEWPI